MPPSFAPLKPRMGFRVRVKGILWSNQCPLNSSSCFRTPGVPQQLWMDSSRVRALIVWEPEAAGETELWSEIAGYSVREAQGADVTVWKD